MDTTLEAPQTYRTPTDADRRKMRADFIAGLGSGPALASAANISYNTVRRWIERENWQQLKDQQDQLDLSRLNTHPTPTQLLPSKIEPIQDEANEDVEKLEAHLKRIDELLETEPDAKNIAQLTRARGDLAEQLCIARYGAKPGTMRPERTKKPSRPIQMASPTEA